MLPIIENTFRDWNLTVDPTKTEFVDYTISDDPKLRSKELWRKSLALGSLSCPKLDIQRRIVLGNAAYGKLKKLLKTATIDTSLKIRIYEAAVVSIILYMGSYKCYTSKNRHKSS